MFSKNIWFSTYVDTKFSIVTMMFALHYMFNDIDSVTVINSISLLDIFSNNAIRVYNFNLPSYLIFKYS